MPGCTWAAQSRKTIILSSRHGYWFKWQFLTAMQHHIEILSPEIQCPPLCSCAIVVKDSKLNFILWNWACHSDSFSLSGSWFCLPLDSNPAFKPLSDHDLPPPSTPSFKWLIKLLSCSETRTKLWGTPLKHLCTLTSSNWSATLQTERAAWFKQLWIRQLVFASNSSIGTSSQECHENHCQHLA